MPLLLQLLPQPLILLLQPMDVALKLQHLGIELGRLEVCQLLDLQSTHVQQQCPMVG